MCSWLWSRWPAAAADMGSPGMCFLTPMPRVVYFLSSSRGVARPLMKYVLVSATQKQQSLKFTPMKMPSIGVQSNHTFGAIIEHWRKPHTPWISLTLPTCEKPIIFFPEKVKIGSWKNGVHQIYEKWQSWFDNYRTDTDGMHPSHWTSFNCFVPFQEFISNRNLNSFGNIRIKDTICDILYKIQILKLLLLLLYK